LLVDAYHCDAIATHNGQAITLPIKSLRDSLADGNFSIKWVRLLSKEIMRLRTQSERLGLKDIRSKLIHLIEDEGKNGVLTLQSDLKSMASEIGVTHEALYRAIATLEKEGLLEKHSDSLELRKKK
jgi:CRP-like cAMP-binding protein